MTIPGNMLRDSVNRLAEVIRAGKDTSDDIKGRVAAQQVTPVTIEQEVNRDGSGGEQGPA